MKKQIVGIVVLMLVATTVVSATNGLNVKENIQPKPCGANAPVYKVGDSWTYTWHETDYKYLKNHTRWYTLYHNCTITMTITAVSDTNYTEKWTSTNNEGRAIISKYRFKFTPYTKYTGEDIFRKSDLAVWSETQQEKGLAFWLMGNLGFPMPVRFLQVFNVVFKEPWPYLPFPLNASTHGNLLGGSQTWNEKCTLDWIIKLFDWPVVNYTWGPIPYNVEMANVTVPAGTYNAYNVSVDVTYGLGHQHQWRYYAPEVGNEVKYYSTTDWDDLGNPGEIITTELVSTTYTP